MRVHLIGVCGTAMGTLAALLKNRGHEVSGSDAQVYPPMSDFLAAEGITLREGYRAEHLEPPPDLVVVGNAISRGNAELEAALDRRLRYASLPEAVRDFFLWEAQPIVIAGTHGKTTTTALTGWLLTACGHDPTVLVGGIVRNFGQDGSSYRVGAGSAFVIEGDEYDSAYFDKTAKFLKYLPQIAVVNNLEFDHADIYADLEAVRLAFRRLLALVPRNGLTLLGIDSAEAAALAPLVKSRAATFGLNESATWRAIDLRPVRAGDEHGSAVPGAANLEPPALATRFRLLREGADLGEFVLPLVGEHNVRNALAAIAVCHDCGIAIDQVRAALKDFRGVKRRLDLLGTVRDVSVYDDFAHHPTAVAETLRAVRDAAPNRRVWAVFEPRSASSCRRVFQDDFARAFGAADRVVLAPVFRSSLPESERLSTEQLVRDLRAGGTDARELPDVDAIVAAIAGEAAPGDLVVIMSNGGFGGIHRRLLEAL